MGQCTANTAAGERCRARSLHSGPKCFAHTNPGDWKAASDRGRQNQQVERCPKVVDIYDVRTPEGTLHLLAECLMLTRAGLLPTRVGHTVAALANSARAYHELCDLADRVAALEESVGRPDEEGMR